MIEGRKRTKQRGFERLEHMEGLGSGLCCIAEVLRHAVDRSDGL